MLACLSELAGSLSQAATLACLSDLAGSLSQAATLSSLPDLGVAPVYLPGSNVGLPDLAR